MSRSQQRTLLSRDYYAKLIGLNPVHFSSAIGGTFWPDQAKCEDIWWEYSWQTPEEFVSRSELDIAIYNAEKDMERILGYSVSPRFVNEEVLSYPRPYQRGYYSLGNSDVRGGPKLIKTRLGKLISPGRRAVTILSSGITVVYSDEDGDTWKETATLSFTDSTTDLREIKVYFTGKSADPAWEIRSIRSITRSGSTVIIKLDSWLFINPTLLEKHPQSNERPEPIDISGVTNFVTTCDVYREYVDTTTVSAQLLWGPNPGFTDDENQNGYLSISDPNLGYVSAFASTYTDDEWITDCVGRDPDRVKIWYYAGALSDEFLAGFTTNPLSDYFATTIAWLATARLTKKICSCGQAQNFAAELQKDMTQISKGSTFVLNLATDLFTNPFGTRVGEYRAWQRVARLMDDYVVIGGVA